MLRLKIAETLTSSGTPLVSFDELEPEEESTTENSNGIFIYLCFKSLNAHSLFRWLFIAVKLQRWKSFSYLETRNYLIGNHQKALIV